MTRKLLWKSFEYGLQCDDSFKQKSQKRHQEGSKTLLFTALKHKDTQQILILRESKEASKPKMFIIFLSFSVSPPCHENDDRNVSLSS